MANKFIQIGELLHGSIPSSAKAMKELQAKGEAAFETDSPELDKIKAIIVDQVEAGADYIDVNVDDFVEADSTFAQYLMRGYTKSVKRFSNGIPICVDSSNDDILIAGLEEWYAGETPASKPMVNSVKTYNTEIILPLRNKYDFSFIALLMSESNMPANADDALKELLDQAEIFFDKAIKYGFTADDFFYDTGVYPLAIDMPMNPGQPSYTWRTFETVKAIKSNPKFNGVHFSLGFSNCCRDLPGRRIGITRAYVHKSIQIGVDAGIVSPKHCLHEGQADSKQIELIESFADLNGDMDKLTTAMTLMGEFCQSCK